MRGARNKREAFRSVLDTASVDEVTILHVLLTADNWRVESVPYDGGWLGYEDSFIHL